jgi:uncharacterized membrane protein
MTSTSTHTPARRRAAALLVAALVAVSAGAAHAIVVRTTVGYRPHPVARTAAVVGTAAVTAAVVGSVVHSVPPSCTSVMVGNVAYQQCGNTWYQPRYAGSQVTYVVVSPPR